MTTNTTKRRAVRLRKNGNEYLAFEVSFNGFETYREIGPRQWKYLNAEDVTTEAQRARIAAFELAASLRSMTMQERCDYNVARQAARAATT